MLYWGHKQTFKITGRSILAALCNTKGDNLGNDMRGFHMKHSDIIYTKFSRETTDNNSYEITKSI